MSELCCRECERLRKEYELAIKSQLKVESDRQIAALQHDRTALELTDTKYNETASQRASTRQELVTHQQTFHGFTDLTDS